MGVLDLFRRKRQSPAAVAQQLGKVENVEEQVIQAEQDEIGIIRRAEERFTKIVAPLGYNTWSISAIHGIISQLDIIEREILNARMYDRKLKRTALKAEKMLRTIRQSDAKIQYFTDKEYEVFVKAKRSLRELDQLREKLRDLKTHLVRVTEDTKKRRIEDTWYSDKETPELQKEAHKLRDEFTQQIHSFQQALTALYKIEETAIEDLQKYEAMLKQA